MQTVETARTSSLAEFVLLLKTVLIAAVCLSCIPPARASINEMADPAIGQELQDIGGPITGLANVNYYVEGPEPSITLSAASNQPSGVTYHWTVSGPLTIDGSATGASVTVSGTPPGGAASGTVNLTYTLGTENASAPAYTVYVHQPTSVKSIAGQGQAGYPFYANPTYDYGFQAEYVQWALYDQMGRPMVGETVSENWDKEVLDNSTIGLKAPLTGSQTTIAPSMAYPWNVNSSWSTGSGGVFDDQDAFTTKYWGCNASGTLVWNFTTGSKALFTAEHQFMDNGLVTNHETSWSTSQNNEPNNY